MRLTLPAKHGAILARLVVIAACVMATNSIATAADAPLVTKAPNSTRYDDWTGFYFGGHVGYTRGNARVTLTDPDPPNFSKSFGTLTGGVQAGYNWLLPSRVLLGRLPGKGDGVQAKGDEAIENCACRFAAVHGTK
jgi:high affinity Mn2+ porin